MRGLDSAFLGFAAVVELDLEHQEGESGYMSRPPRVEWAWRSAPSSSTSWGFDELGLLRLELRIDTENAASSRVAERAGYQRDGVLRNVHFKEGCRCDLAVWSRLSQD